jgi:hypothetical protein
LLGVVDFNAFDSLQGNHSDELLVLGDPAWLHRTGRLGVGNLMVVTIDFATINTIEGYPGERWDALVDRHLWVGEVEQLLSRREVWMECSDWRLNYLSIRFFDYERGHIVNLWSSDLIWMYVFILKDFAKTGRSDSWWDNCWGSTIWKLRKRWTKVSDQFQSILSSVSYEYSHFKELVIFVIVTMTFHSIQFNSIRFDSISIDSN